MKQIRPILATACLVVFSCQLSAQTEQQSLPEAKTSKTTSMGVLNLSVTGKGLFTFSRVKPLNINTGVNEERNVLLQPHPMVEWKMPEAKMQVSVTNDADKKQALAITMAGLDASSVNFEIIEISGRKVLFNKENAVFDSVTGQLRVSLVIEKGFYTFKIPTASGVITETLSLFWK